MHVDVDALGWNLQKKMNLGAPLLDRGDAVRLSDGVRDGTVLDDAAVDEDVLRAPDRPFVSEGGNVALDGDAAGFLPDFDQIGPFPVQLKEPLARADCRWTGEQAPAATCQREAHLGIAQCQLRNQTRDLPRFRRIRLQKLAPRWQVVEKILDLDRRSFRRADLSLATKPFRR